MIAALVFAAFVAPPTPSPSFHALPDPVINYYAAEGARASGLDTALVRAVIDNESAGDPHAVSSAGAEGLMQLEPAAAADCGLSDRFDASGNVRCGATLLASLIHAYGMRAGIASYNFGPHNVTSGKPWPPETKAYVDRVIGDYDKLQHGGDLEAAAPTPSPVPSAKPLPSADPCAHRIMCGAIHLVPKDANERRAFYLDMGLAFLDGIVTRNGLRLNNAPFPTFGSRSACASVPTCAAAATHAEFRFSFGVTDGGLEINPLMRPFVHDGLGSVVAGGIFWAAVQSTLTRHWSPHDRATLDYDEAALHVVGIATWLPHLAAYRRDSALYPLCASALSHGFVGAPLGGAPGSLVVYKPHAVPAPVYPGGWTSITQGAVVPAGCDRFSNFPILNVAAPEGQ